ncbi:MAG: A24 family peptidase [Aquabacterium sp.]
MIVNALDEGVGSFLAVPVLHGPTLLLLLWACSIAYFDARYRRIPNVLSLGAWLLGLAVLAIHQSSLMGAPWSSALWAAGFGLLATLPAYLVRKLGAGDVKFMVAIGLLTSLPVTIRCFVVAAGCAGLMALFWLAIPHLRHALAPPWQGNGSRLARWLDVPASQRRMAFGTLLSAGLLASLWWEI